MTNLIPESSKKFKEYFEQAMDLENTMYDRMRKLEPEEFDNFKNSFQKTNFVNSYWCCLGAAVDCTGLYMYSV